MALHRRAHVLAFGVGDFFESLHGDAGLFCEGLGRRGRCAVFEGYLPRGTGQLFLGIGLARQHIFDQHGQTARRGVGSEFGLGAKKSLAREQIVHAAA